MVEASGREAPPSPENLSTADHGKTGKLLRKFAPAVLGSALFLLNNLGVMHAFIGRPAGYAPFGVQRHSDIAQYLTWLAGLKIAWVLPNYHAPWITPPGLIVAGLFPAAVLERWFSIPPVAAFQIFNFGAYLATAYALAFAYRTFFQTRKQAFRAFVISLACVPLASLPGVFRLFHNIEGVGTLLGWSAGAYEFMLASDGFLRGLVAFPLMTWGTCFEILAVTLLARYCRSHETRWFGWLVAVCFLAALVHPFEVFVIVFVAAIVLLQEPGPTARRLGRIAIILVAAGAGMLPYVIQNLRVPWVREMADANRTSAYMPPAYMFLSLGLPAMAVVLFLLCGLPKSQERGALILKTWFVSVWLLFYAPGLPFPLHFFDGMLFAIGMLLAMQIEELEKRRPLLTQPAFRFALTLAVIWMLLPNLTFRVRSWKDGVALSNIRFASAMAPNDEMAALAWLRKNATPDDLILANGETGSWLAAAPVHSFQSHWMFSSAAERPQDAELKSAFFAGTMPVENAHEFLETLGVRFVVVPDDSRARAYLQRALMRVNFSSSAIYEIPGAHMKPYEDSAIVQMGK
jgi:hypothetical protein